MTFTAAPTDEALGLYGGMLPSEHCSACHDAIKRRSHRVYVRTTWHGARDVLCPGCWNTICSWAARFALEQLPFAL